MEKGKHAAISQLGLLALREMIRQVENGTEQGNTTKLVK